MCLGVSLFADNPSQGMSVENIAFDLCNKHPNGRFAFACSGCRFADQVFASPTATGFLVFHDDFDGLSEKGFRKGFSFRPDEL